MRASTSLIVPVFFRASLLVAIGTLADKVKELVASWCVLANFVLWICFHVGCFMLLANLLPQ